MSRLSRWPTGPSFLTTAALLALLAPGAAAGQLLSEGVVVDADAGVAYAMSPGGGIDAVDLATGAVRWRSGAAAKPLHLADGLLIAQSETAAPGSLDLAALDVGRDGAARHAMTVSLPAGVWAGVDDRPGRAFRCQVGGAASDLVAAWRESRAVDQRFAVRAPALDEASGPVIAPAAPQGSLAGAARIDLVAGRVTALSPDEIAAAPLTRTSSRAGSFLPGLAGRQRLSADGRHVLVSERTGAPGEWLKYRWSIYTAAGEPVGSFSHHTASAPFVVAGATLVFEDRPFGVVRDGELVSAPLSLRGVDLASGEERWSRPVRDIAYRGPFQP